MAHAKPLTWREFALAAGRVMGRRPRLVRLPLPAVRMAAYCAEIWSYVSGKPGIVSREKICEAECRNWTCDSGRAAAELGFEAATPIEAGLAKTLAWYKEAGWLKF
jgi:nucleoside-diphosphate-sugar epimerase